MCLTLSVWRIWIPVDNCLMNSKIVDSLQQGKFKVHTPFCFEAVDQGTKTA